MRPAPTARPQGQRPADHRRLCQGGAWAAIAERARSQNHLQISPSQNAIVPGLLQRHGTGGRGRQPAPPQGASDKTSGSISTSMPSSASPGMPPEPPAVHGSLPGDDETASLPSLVSKLSPLAASKRPAGALSPTDVALFPTSPCTAECCLKEASHTPGALPSGGCPGNPICGLSARSAAPC